jgi:hypothetical protein
MKRTEQDLASRIAGLLDESAGEMDRRTAERLATARRRALDHYRPEPVPVWRWLLAGGAGGSHAADPRRYAARMLLVAAAVASAVAIGMTWTTSRGTDIAEIDAALLSDELPINAFLDQRLDSWLKRVSR